MKVAEMWAERIQNLPPYLFAEIDRIKGDLRKKGVDIIDLSIGDPDLPTPSIIVEALREHAKKAENHRYPSYMGSERFRRAISRWYEDRFGVSLDPMSEVVVLIGSKEGIGHLPLAFVNAGDVALVPDPGYPVYATATTFAGGTPVTVPLRKEGEYRAKLSDISEDAAKKAKLFFLNYPNNPTSAVVDISYFEEVASFCRTHDILLCHDAAYTEVSMGGHEPPSFLQAKGSKEIGIEFHSLSKTFNMTGWRVAFAVGNRDAISALGKIKTNVDSGVFGAIQEAGIVALEHWKNLREANNAVYEHRRDIMAEGLRKLGINFQLPKSTFYLWCKVPGGESSAVFCERMLQQVGICFTPGSGFGKEGEGYFRIALTASEVRLQEALGRLQKKLG